MMDKPKEPGPTASAAEWSVYANAMAKYADWVTANPQAAGEAQESAEAESAKSDDTPARTAPRQPAPPRKPAV
jgi:hypothetical protein